MLESFSSQSIYIDDLAARPGGMETIGGHRARSVYSCIHPDR